MPSSSARRTTSRATWPAYRSPYPHSRDPNCQVPSPILEISLAVPMPRYRMIPSVHPPAARRTPASRPRPRQIHRRVTCAHPCPKLGKLPNLGQEHIRPPPQQGRMRMRSTAWKIGLAAVSVLGLAGLGVSGAAAASHATTAAPATGLKVYNTYVTYYGWY